MIGLKILGIILTIAYPILIFASITLWHFPVRIIGLILLLMGSTAMIFNRKKRTQVVPILAAIIAIIVIFTKCEQVLKFYPIIVNAVFLFTFLTSINKDDSIVFKFALLGDKTVKWSNTRNLVAKYCKKVTIVWCVFFIINSICALLTVLFGSSKIWAIYNGLVSYVIMGLIFFVEFIIRITYQNKINVPIKFSTMSEKSREDDCIITYSGRFTDGKYKYWKDFVSETAKVRAFINSKNVDKVILHADDFWFFLVGLTAILQTEKDLLVSSNISQEFIKEIVDEKTLCLFDNNIDELSNIAYVIKNYPQPEDLKFPSISKKAPVYLFTSGSTGTPKAIFHCFKELEDDNDCLGEEWTKNFVKRIQVSSVNPHHAFGIVFAALKPFMFGIPLRRERILEPNDITKAKEDLLFISTPAFLNLSIKDDELKEPLKNNIQIIIAGAPISKEELDAVSKIYKIYPIEIYGSTETGAIAWRQYSDEEHKWWTTMNSIVTSLTEESCLIVKGNAIHEDSFVTSDVVKIREDGKFILFGRKDSIVKIAEKRISLIEVANRIKQTKLVSDAVSIVITTDKRQFLGAAVVLSKEGKELTKDMNHAEMVKLFRTRLSAYMEGVTIPRRWRFVEEIPHNNMGKLQMKEIMALFDKEL